MLTDSLPPFPSGSGRKLLRPPKNYRSSLKYASPKLAGGWFSRR